jgi:hypothetical protein
MTKHQANSPICADAGQTWMWTSYLSSNRDMSLPPLLRAHAREPDERLFGSSFAIEKNQAEDPPIKTPLSM